jgi:hypothetical protein
MKDSPFKKNITMHIKRRETKGDKIDLLFDDIIVNSEITSYDKSDIKKEDYFQDENSDDFLHKYYRVHTKEFSLFELYNNISGLLFHLRIYIILVFICVIFVVMYS